MLPVVTERFFAEEEVESKTQVKRLSPSKLLTGNLGAITKRKKDEDAKSKKTQRIKIASQGALSSATRTNVAEVWVPLQGAGPEARLLIKLQGALLSC